MNVHVQCKHCNQFRPDNEMHEDYTKFMIETYGEGAVAELDIASHAVHRLTQDYLSLIIKHYRSEIEKELARIGETCSI